MNAAGTSTPPMPGSFLAAVDMADGAALVRAGAVRHFSAHTTLFHSGDPSTHVVLLLDGWVKVSAVSRNGYEALLAIRGPGDMLGASEQGGIVIDIPLSQRELAGSVGASREAVARALRILRERHVVTTKRQRIVIVRPQVLRSIGGVVHIDT